MKTEITLTLRIYPVVIEDTRRPGMVQDDTITLEKGLLQACQMVGQSATELIYRIYNRRGFKVHEIGKPVKKSVRVDLDKLVEMDKSHGADGGEAGA